MEIKVNKTFININKPAKAMYILHCDKSWQTFLKCFQMSRLFYHSVIHGLGFFICFMIET